MSLDLAALHALAASGRPGPWWLGVLRAGLRGAAGLYGLGAGGKNLLYDLGLRKPRRLPAPVIGVGNLVAGGTGKTPLVMAVVRALWGLGLPAAVISRGYGAAAGRGGVTWVSRGHGPLVDAQRAGDEPLLLARRLPAPVAAGPDRWEVGRAVLAQCGPRVLVCDDLFQHRRLHRDLDLVALDAARPLGNGHLLPAGHLREPAAGLRRAGALVLTRADDAAAVDQDRRWLRSFWGPGPVLACRHRLAGLDDAQGQPLPEADRRGKPVLAFCGLADPDQFAAGLTRAGLAVLDLAGFPDHHFFTPAELGDLWRRAAALGAAALVCSEKDWVRLPAELPPGPPLWVTRLELEFAPDQPDLASVLAWGLSAWRAGA
ncbi:MAG: tetraacyldisaccharide 4'-kinase [Desulfarculus sp.]|nr:tetraacyldisaccharide 4'-kinase [Desulfarculus sp.]